MIKATFIHGLEAVAHHKKTGTIPTPEWLLDHGGVVDEIEFKTKVEYDSYVRGLSDGHGWSDYHIIKPESFDESALSKELRVFLFPIDRFERNATDEEIIADWNSAEDRDIPIQCITPDELAAMLNDDDAGFSEQWVRFILV